MCSLYAFLWLSKLQESIAKEAVVAAAAAAAGPRVVALVRVPRVPGAAAVRVLPAPRHARRPQVEFIRAIRRRAQSRAREPPLSTHAGACRHTTRHIARITMVQQRCAL